LAGRMVKLPVTESWKAVSITSAVWRSPLGWLLYEMRGGRISTVCGGVRLDGMEAVLN
jgi:hypothetical protein